MSSHAVACPQCHAALRSSRPLPENKKVRCPQCGTSFTTPAAVVATLPAAPPPLPCPTPEQPPTIRSSGATVWVPALFAGVFLLGGMGVAAIYFAQPRPPAPQP